MGNIYGSNKKLFDKKKDILKILNNKEVREMFDYIDISSLNLGKKQKLITYCYKYKIFISTLVLYMSKK